MRRSVVALMIVCATTTTALAGKRERDLINKELVPAVKDAQDKWKAGCGCTLTITIDPVTQVTMDDIRLARNGAKDVAENAPKYCTDAASKKAVCQMTTLVITKAKPATFTFSGGKGVMSHDGNGRASWLMMMRVLDK